MRQNNRIRLPIMRLAHLLFEYGSFVCTKPMAKYAIDDFNGFAGIIVYLDFSRLIHGNQAKANDAIQINEFH